MNWKTCTSSTSVVAILALAAAASAQPPNDSCANAIPVAANAVTTFNVLGATRDGSLPCEDDPGAAIDVWYSYTTTGPERVTVSTCGSSTPTVFNMLGVFNGCGGPSVACAGFNNCDGAQATVTFETAGAATYLICISGYRNYEGDSNLVVTTVPVVPVPANDTCAGAFALHDGDNAVDNRSSTQDTQIPCASGGPGNSGPDTWYSYTATETGFRTFAITSFLGDPVPDTNLAILSSCDGTLLDCNDDNGVTQLSTIPNFHIVAGTTYKVRFATHPSRQTGTGNLRITPANPAFDACEFATPVVGSTSIAFDTTGLTNDRLEGFGVNDGWYAWTPTQSGVANVTTCGGTITGDPSLAAFVSCGGAMITRNNNDGNMCIGLNSTIVFPATAGVPVLVRIASMNGGPSTGQVTFSVVQPPLNDTCANAQVLPGPGVYPFDNTYATTQGPSGSCNLFGRTDTRDLFYQYTAGNEGTITLRTSRGLGTSLDTNLQIFDSCGGAELACNDDQLTFWDINSRICEFPVENGHTYIIRIAMYTGLTSGGPAALTLTHGPSQYAPPVGAIPEPGNRCDEHYTTDVNYACDTQDGTNHFTPLNLCDTFEGHVSYRGAPGDPSDVDAYEFTLSTPQSITVTGQTLFNGFVAMSQGCTSNFIAYGGIYPTIACGGVADFSFTYPHLAAGTYRLTFSMYDRNDQSVVCGSGNDRYWFHIEGSEPCPALCAADLGVQGGVPGHDGILDNNDFVIFIDYFFNANPAADFGVQGGLPGHDGLFDNNDFIVFIDAFFDGCP